VPGFGAERARKRDGGSGAPLGGSCCGWALSDPPERDCPSALPVLGVWLCVSRGGGIGPSLLPFLSSFLELCGQGREGKTWGWGQQSQVAALGVWVPLQSPCCQACESALLRSNTYVPVWVWAHSLPFTLQSLHRPVVVRVVAWQSDPASHSVVGLRAALGSLPSPQTEGPCCAAGLWALP
jgi:hypothetical protein